MSIRSERIKALVEHSGLSYQEIEKLTGIKKSSLQRYASGVTTKIPLDVIEKLAKAFNVSQEYLMGWDEKKDSHTELELSEGEEKILELFRRIPEERQGYALEVLEALLKMQQRP